MGLLRPNQGASRMRDLFPEYYIPREEDFQKAWNTGLFVFDANVLLNLYGYSDWGATALSG